MVEEERMKISKRPKMNQTDFPRGDLKKALSIAETIWEKFSGKGTAPYEVALSMEMSPTSGTWRNLCGTSIAYGLTKGGYNANEIELTDLGLRIVAPTIEGEDKEARVEAILQPRIMGEFFRNHDKGKFPNDTISENVLIKLGIPKERASRAVEIIKNNGIYTGVLRESKTGLFVALGSPVPKQHTDEEYVTDDEDTGDGEKSFEEIAQKVSGNSEDITKQIITVEENNKVFISHGKNNKIVNQLKELLKFGKFEPIVSIEKETPSIPVPEKVFDDMRICSAAVIHVGKEGELLDSEGNTHERLNENVLIEIGAAIALYRNRFVLLVEKGVRLPSNLQGLYRCEYEGDQLDYNATMKLLKTFNEFR